MSRSPDPEDVRLRFGMDPPRLEERAHWEELAPGADEWVAPRDGLYRITYQPVELSADADGEA